MNLINLKIQSLKNKKNEIKSKRKEINTTFNDPTQTDRELIKVDNEISKEKLQQLDNDRKERQKKKEAQQQQLVMETKETIRSIYKLLARLGICKNSSQMGLIMGQGKSYFRLYTGDFVNRLKYSNLEEVKQNLWSLKTGLNILLENDETLPPRDWIEDKITLLMNKLDNLQYRILELDLRG